MESMQLHEDRIGGQHIFSGRVVNLKVDQIRLPNGHTSIREVIEHPGGVTVAALNERDELLMVRQFRYPFQNVLLELPAGKAGTRRNAFGRRPPGTAGGDRHQRRHLYLSGPFLRHPRLLHGADSHLACRITGHRPAASGPG